MQQEYQHKFTPTSACLQKYKSLIFQLYYLPILDLQSSNHPGGSISFFAQKIADFKSTNTIVNVYNESISKNLRWPAPIYEI